MMNIISGTHTPTTPNKTESVQKNGFFHVYIVFSTICGTCIQTYGPTSRFSGFFNVKKTGPLPLRGSGTNFFFGGEVCFLCLWKVWKAWS